MIGAFMRASSSFARPVQNVLMGSVLFGAGFMASDYVTRPHDASGQRTTPRARGLSLPDSNVRRNPEGTTLCYSLMNISYSADRRATKGRISGGEDPCVIRFGYWD